MSTTIEICIIINVAMVLVVLLVAAFTRKP